MPSTLRIKPPASKKLVANDTMAEEGTNEYDSYLARLAKLIPGEAVSIYLTARNMMSSGSDNPENVNLICPENGWLPLVGLIPLLIIRIFGTRVLNPEESSLLKKNDIEWSLVGISAISYMLWIYAIGDCFFGIFQDISDMYIAITVMLWTFLVPYLYKAPKPYG